MEQIALADAKEHLEDLIARAVKGDDIVIADATLGTVRLSPVAGPIESVQAKHPRRVAGRLRGIYEVPEGLFDPLPDDELARWSGEGE